MLQAILTAQLKERITGPGAAKVSRRLSFCLPSRATLIKLTLPQTIERIRHVATSIKEMPPAIQVAARTSYRNALHGVFGLNLGVAVLCLLFTLPLREYALPASFAEEEEHRRQRNGEETPPAAEST